MKKNYKSRLLVLVTLLFASVFAVSCHKGKEEQLTEEEQALIVLENAELVMDNVSEFYRASETVEEMAQHLDEIKAMENVEDAWQNDIAICVKIKNGGIVKWCFFPLNTGKEKISNFTIKSVKLNNKNLALCEEKTACIAVAIPYLSDPLPDELVIIGNKLKKAGYNVKYVLGEEVTPYFLCYEMPNYGVNILVTHGDYDDNGKHSIMTGIKYDLSDVADFERRQYGRHLNASTTGVGSVLFISDWSEDMVQLFYVKDYVGNDSVYRHYLGITESFFETNMTQHFPKNSLLFVSACKTLKSNNNFAAILYGKGLGCYFGYDNPVRPIRSFPDVLMLMEKMLEDGCTSREAYEQVGSGFSPKLLMCPYDNNIVLVIDTFFSVSPTMKVQFASGNLSSGGGGFVANQWDYGGYFGWGQNDNVTSQDVSYYQSFVDWGTRLGEDSGWRTLTKDEWEYLFFNRPNANDKLSAAIVNGIRGLLILPNGWALPDDCPYIPGFGGGWGGRVSYTSAQWSSMEDAGAVFLPASGGRIGGDVYYDNDCGFYWTSTPDGGAAYRIAIYSDSLKVFGHSPRYFGQSVRLARDVELE